MSITRIHVRQVRLGPEVPLGRRGCLVESFKTHEAADGWCDTFFAGAVSRHSVGPIIQLLRDRGEEVFTVIKRLNYNKAHQACDFNPSQQASLEELKRMGVVQEDSAIGQLRLEYPKADWGSGLECAALVSLADLHIQAHREVKVKYPYKDAQYDPDGQKYDVLAGLDLSRLLWIECKKPLYLDEGSDALGQVLSKAKVQEFYRRAHYLRPDIAVFLVDTKFDYRSDLRALFTQEFLSSGCFMVPAPPANQLMGRLHGFIYFARVKYRSSREYMDGLRHSISQVLHDARSHWLELSFSGDPFR